MAPDRIRLFIHFLNPELLHLHLGPRAALSQRTIFTAALRILRYALLIGDEPIILPASNLFETDGIERLLLRLRPVLEADLIYFSSPTADLAIYAEKKRREFRDQPSLFPAYTSIDILPGPMMDAFRWIPRVQLSASREIQRVWQDDLMAANGLWAQLFVDAGLRGTVSVEQYENNIASVPERLDGRASLFRYMAPLLPLELAPGQSTRVKMLINRGYLTSFLDEFDAAIIYDTPLGSLDCGIGSVSSTGSPRLVSFRSIAREFDLVGIRNSVDHLPWKDIVQLRELPIFRWFATIVTLGLRRGYSHIAAAMRMARISTLGRNRAGKSIKALRDRLTMAEEKLGSLIEVLGDTPESSYVPQLQFSFAYRRVSNSSRPSWVQPDASCEFETEEKEMATKAKDPSSVFVVHGRNEAARSAMFAFLRSLGLRPMEFREAITMTGLGAPSISEILNVAFKNAQAVVVILSGDDEGCLRPQFRSDRDSAEEKTPTPQARQNVLFEAGMALGRHPDRTILVQVGEIRPFSDIAGRHIVHFSGTPDQRNDLVNRLRNAECPVNTAGSDWFTAGDFDAALKLAKRP